jgi:transcriptional regulator with XRE-family HTH domain
MKENDPETGTALTRRIQQELAARKWTMRDLERKAGLKENGVLNILRRKSLNPRIDTLQKIAGAMDCTIGELLGEPPKPTVENRALVFRMILAFLKFSRDGGMELPKDTSDTELEMIAKAFADGAMGQSSTSQADLQAEVAKAVENVTDLQSLRNT